MRVKKIQLLNFKRFTDMTIDLGSEPKKVIVLVGPNGCGKSCVFDAFEDKIKDVKGGRSRNIEYLCKESYSGATSSEYNIHNRIKIFTDNASQSLSKTSLYIRSSYRFTARLDINQIRKLPEIESDANRPQSSSDLDSRLQENYERLLGGFYDDVYDKDKSGKQWHDDNVTYLNNILLHVLDIKISNLGNPVEGRGKLYFEKGASKNFAYENLSSGEKEVIDLVLDLIIKRKTYTNTVFCIDEPELHINTAIQRKLLIELEKLIPDNCQLWIATHSIGFLRAIQEKLKDKTQIIDMGDKDFDSAVTLQPVMKTRKNWQRIFRTALEDLGGLVAPKLIVYCEGKLVNSLDEHIFNSIFHSYDDVLFVSATSKNESIKYAGVALTVLNKAFDDVKIRVVVDRDETGCVIPNSSSVDIRKLKRREFENYVFDYEIISRAYPHISKSSYDAIVSNIENIDIKSKYVELLKLSGASDVKEMKLKLVENISSETNIYKELNSIIFG